MSSSDSGKLGLGDKLKQKLHLGTTSTHSSRSSTQQSSSMSHATHTAHPKQQTRQPMFDESRSTSQQSPHATGARIAEMHGGVQYEDTPGASLSGGGTPAKVSIHQSPAPPATGNQGIAFMAVPAGGAQIPIAVGQQTGHSQPTRGLQQPTVPGTPAQGVHEGTPGATGQYNTIGSQPGSQARAPVSPDMSESLSKSGAAPGGPVGGSSINNADTKSSKITAGDSPRETPRMQPGYEGEDTPKIDTPPRQEQHITPDLSAALADSSHAPGGPAGSHAPHPESNSNGQGGLGTTKPQVTDVGMNSAGQNTSDAARGANQGRDSQPEPEEVHKPQSSGPSNQDREGSKVSSTPAGLGAQSQAALESTKAALQDTTPEGVWEKTKEVVQTAAVKVQEIAQPYVEKVQQVSQPLVDKAAEATNAAAERAQPTIARAKETAQQQAAAAAAQAQHLGQVGQEKASQAYDAAAAELDRRGVNQETTQQKLADVGQAMKDYSAVGQERAGEYLQQAVGQARTIGEDSENKNIIVKIFGTVALIWLAFGFSLTALIALGIAGTIAAILSRYSRKTVGPAGSRVGVGAPEHQTSLNANPSPLDASPDPTASGVETHYPRPGHPDNSLNALK